VNNIRIYAHCVEEPARAPQPAVITHVWTEEGVRRSKQVQLAEVREYEIETTTDPVDESVEIAVASQLRGK
jgi:hypothetical protein